MKKALVIILCIIICMATGAIASLFQTDALQSWYPMLNKESLTPPDDIFPIVWSILYILMGISAGLVITTSHPKRTVLVLLFVFQLLLNFLWSILFFRLESPLLGFIDIILLEIAILAYIFMAYPVSKWASWLFVPYALWVAFAGYLNFYILFNN